jgi:two-component system, cell cycle sensor histidine kinase and response regulator CckA
LKQDSFDPKWPASILVVEDESIIALDIKATLQGLGYEVQAIAATGQEAIDKAERLRPDLVLMDIHLRGEIDGIEAIRLIRKKRDVPVIYLTAYADPGTVQRARETEPYGYLLKPFEQRELHIVIEMALHRHEMERRLRESESWLAATLRSIGDSVIATDGEWRVRFMNPAAEKLTGWPAEEALGRELAQIVPVSIPAPPRPLAADDRHSGGGIAQGILITRDGRRMPIEESSTTIRDEAGRVIGSVLAIREIAERKPSQGG